MKLFEQGMFTVSPNSTPDQLARKRERIYDMLSGNKNARYVGEGLGHLATGILAGKQLRDVDKIEGKGREGANDLFASLMGGIPSQHDYTPAMVPQGEAQTAVTPPADGDDPYQVFNASLARTESGGNYNITNSEGYGGKYQFGQGRLDDFNRAMGTGYKVANLTAGTPEAKALTEAVQRWHIGDIDKYAESKGLNSYIGQNIGGVTITQDGMRAMAHLGGKGGMEKFLRSGGRYNPADSNGTHLSDYARTHAGGGSTPQAGAPQPNNSAQLQAALANPWLSPEQKAVISQQIAQQQQRNDLIFRSQLEQQDPMYQAKLAELQSGGGSGNVRASQILADGTVVQSTDTGVRVYSADGTLLEGEAASEAIKAANAYDVENQRSIYGGRREGTLGADIGLGGEAAAAVELGKETIETGMAAYQSASGVYQSLGNIQTAIDAIDGGAKAGAIQKFFPNVTEASASLNNAMNRMGLDVIGSVTFGALSEGEMKLAMSTAVPRDLSPKALRSWLVKKRDAQEKAARTLMDAAYYLTTPGNNINGWIELNRSKQPITPEAGSGDASDEDLFLKYGVE